MIRKNVSGQHIFFCMVVASSGAADGSATVTVKVTIDGGSQNAGAGSVTNLGNGQYVYAPTQGETNGNQIGFFFTATSDVPVSIMVTTTAADLTDSVRLGLSALPNGPMQVKKNQALNSFMFPMFDTSGNPKTGLTITSQRAIDGGSFAGTTNSATELSNGWYTLNLSASDLNGTVIALRFSSSGALDTDYTLITQP